MKSIIVEVILFMLGLGVFGVYKEYSISKIVMGCMWFLTFFYCIKLIYFLKFMFFNSEIASNSEKKELMLINKKIKKRYDCGIIQSGLKTKTDRFDFSVCECTYRESFERKDRTHGHKEYVLVEPLSSYFKKLKNRYIVFLSPIGLNQHITLEMEENNYCAAIKSSEVFIYVIYCLVMVFITFGIGSLCA